MAGGAQRPTVKGKNPRFQKLIRPEMVRDRQLAVPKMFAKEYGDGLSSRVVFKIPNGAEWPIRLSGSGDKMWFGEGWRQFADFHSLTRMGYFLVFEYLGDSRFLVGICDPSASEISYPPCNVTDNGADGYPAESRQEPPLNSSETTPDEELSSESSQEIEGCPARKVNRVIGRPRRLSAAKKASVLARARAAFRSDKPFFMLAMEPSFVYAPFNRDLPLPVEISDVYFNENRGETVLQLPDGRRAWTLEYYSVSAAGGKNRAFFPHQYWLAFAKDTNLKVGDVCAFKLMKGGSKLTLEVTIFRAAAQGIGSSAGGNGGICRRTLSAGLRGKAALRRNMPSSKLEGNRARQSAIFDSSSVNRFFKVTVTPGHLPYGRGGHSTKVRIPIRFASFIEKDVCEAELWIGDTYWLVKLWREIQSGNEYINMGTGWTRFALQNSMKVGEVCVFKLIGTKEHGTSKTMKFNVNIYRGK